ncbi:hypothetical protein Btru_003815, partial [Bulinus truncatus]
IPVNLDKPYHAVAFEPLINNSNVMHHMILFGCPEISEQSNPHACGPVDNVCRTFLVQWSMGIKGPICSFPDTGVRFGVDSLKSLSLQIHWNNDQHNTGIKDSSGVRVYYTSKLQKYDVGNVQVGQNDIEIPPAQRHFQQQGSCSSDCTKKWLQQPIYLTRAHIHLHYTGDGGILDLVRNGETVKEIIRDNSFDYHSPPAHNLQDPVEVLPGDEIRLTCFYNTQDGAKQRNITLYWGEGSDGEMCYAFITYFPKVNNFDQCIQFDRYDICSTDGNALMGNCVVEGFVRYYQRELADQIIKYCSNDYTFNGHIIDMNKICSKSCESSIAELTENPCMQDRIGKLTLREYLTFEDSWSKVKVILDAAKRYCMIDQLKAILIIT